MEGISAAQAVSGFKSPQIVSYRSVEASFSYRELVIQKTLGSDQGNDQVTLGIPALSQGLSVSAEEIVKRINEKLKSVLPDGVQSLKPEETTPEATADKIVKGVTGLFDYFAKRHPELQGEDLLTGFMDTIRAGVEQGYGDASKFLSDNGAFEIDGVKSGIEKTKGLIDQKLKEFEATKRKELGLDSKDPEVKAAAASTTSDSLLAQIGAGLNLVA